MIWALWKKSFRDSWPLLLACCGLLLGFLWFRLWVVAQIDFQKAITLLAKMVPQFVQQNLPAPLEALTAGAGQVAFGWEEGPVLLLSALWSVSRGTHCLAGRLGDGSMEMLLAQPVRRITLVASHTGVTLVGAAAIASSAWLGTALGLATCGQGPAISATTFLPIAMNLFALCVLLVGIATLASALASSRGAAVAMVVGFYIVELTCKVLSMVSPNVAWLKWLTFLTAYQPTRLTLGLQEKPAEHWPLFWQLNSFLLGLGLLTLALATARFCRRDLPAPL